MLHATQYLTPPIQSSSDLPLLVTIRDLSRRLLTSLIPASSPSSPNIQPANVTTPVTAVTPQQLLNHPPTKPQSSQSDEFRIGFITPPFKDSKIPVTDHLHAHAYILPADRMGWWRSVGFGPLAWYSIDDLIAEIREETSNNRIRSGYTSSASSSSQPRPIDLVPAAGARSGTADGIETTEDGLAVDDPEDPEANPRRRSRLSTTSSTDSDTSSTHLTVGRRSTIGMTVDVSGVAAPYLGTGGALVMSPRSMMSEDNLRTPTGAGTATTNLLSPNSQIPHLRV
ncbi:hypothetical protein NLI96_g1378 [Meripilus lineatus]|uniref:Uncharacterized protein n=1 Tax=Meripilus lineatus TaxID=2056292 RepID=A0AAD5YHH1_9APHY|nr:hypothetical protein NLI96_g1378 [Physisporinus lineatus]